MKVAAFLVGFLVIFCVLASVAAFISGSQNFGIAYLIAGILPSSILCFCLYEMSCEKEKGRLPTEDDLKDETLYGVVEAHKSGELVLLKDLSNQKLELYRLTCVPANIFRGKDAKNFSQMKKASE